MIRCEVATLTIGLKNRITYDVPKAASVPFGISVDGARKSPLIFIPDNTPVIVGKNTPNTRNQVYPSLYFAQKFDAKFSVFHPVNPLSGSPNKLNELILINENELKDIT